jgi:hypothetical protein
MIVNNKTARILGSGRFRFIPGKNSIAADPKEEKTLRADPQFRAWCQLGWVSVPLSELPPEPPRETVQKTAEEPAQETAQEAAQKSFVDMTIKEAKAAIAECLNVDILLGAFETETREKVKAAIEARLTELDQ